MNLLRYIKGLRRGKDAHRIELEALKDAFLSEALEGYDAIDDNHLKRIANIQKQIKNYSYKKNETIATTTVKVAAKRTSKKSKTNIPWKKWSVAAIFLLCLLLVGYYIVENYESLLKYRSAVSSKYYKETESKENEIVDTVKVQQVDLIQQDTLTIYMPEPPLPKNKPSALSVKTLQDRLREDRRRIEIIKLDVPQTQLQVPVTLEPQNRTEAVEAEVAF